MQLIPAQTLQKADKILFIAHLAIGDFTYLHNFFAAFAQAHPHIKIDLWIDELRCTSDPKKWPFLEKYSLYDWTEQCSFFNHIYRKTYSPQLVKASIVEAQQQNYPIVVSLATLRPPNYARLARKLGRSAFVIGIKHAPRWFAPWDQAAFNRLDAAFAPFKRPANDYHITDVYADWFYQLCGLQLTQQQRFPSISIPDPWIHSAQTQLHEWSASLEPRVFINVYAKTKKRCWPLANVAKLIIDMQNIPAWKNAHFIVNAMPSEVGKAKQVLAKHPLKNTHLFSAEENFFQLPAILQQCQLIISVETAVMHLANAVHVPVIALMRQKNPEWVPIDSQHSTVITTKRRREWVDTITVDQIINVLPR